MVHRERSAAEERRVVRQIYGERLRELPGAASQLAKRAPVPARSHLVDAAQGFECAHEHCGGDALRAAHQVDHVVVAVREGDVRGARRTVHHGVALRDAVRRCMRPWVVGAEIRLCLDDPSSGQRSSAGAHEYAAEQLRGHERGVAIEE